jgi:hypothetical protein
VILNLEGMPLNFLLNTGASYTVIHSNPGFLSIHQVIIKGVSGKPLTRYFSLPLSCEWDDFLLTHTLLIKPKIPIPLLGRDILAHMHTTIPTAPGQLLCLRLMEIDEGSEVWTTQGRTIDATPAKIHFKDPTAFSTRGKLF